MSYQPQVLPAPQVARSVKGTCRWRQLRYCQVSGLGQDTLECLKKDFPGVQFMRGGSRRCMAVFSASRTPPDRPLPVDPRRSEGYALAVETDRIALTGSDPAGLWWGCQTLRQLTDTAPAGRIPLTTIHDWPMLAVRGIHIDLKGYQPTFEALVDICRTLARYKVNCILLEIEDKFDFTSAPGVGVPGAYTTAQLRQLAHLCAAMHIELIPKLQCLGHADYLLKLPSFAHLREGDHSFQYCPRNAAGFRLWQAMHDELIDALPGGKYFHIGADETFNLGACPVCRRYSKASAYIFRVQKCLGHVKRSGRTPMMWEDVLRNLHGIMDQSSARSLWDLGRDAILTYWAYGYGGYNNVFPFLPSYQEKDLRIWGASGYSGCGPSWIQDIPPLAERMKNIDAWTGAAIAHNLPGVISTGWGKIASADPPAEPHETSWLPAIYSAVSTWTGRATAPEAFARQVAENFFGVEDADFASALIEADNKAVPEPPGRPRRNANRLKLMQQLSTMARHAQARHALLEVLQMYRDQLEAGTLPDYRLDLVRRKISQFEKARRVRMARVRSVMKRFYTPASVDLYVESRFGVDEQILQWLKEHLPSPSPSAAAPRSKRRQRSTST